MSTYTEALRNLENYVVEKLREEDLSINHFTVEFEVLKQLIDEKLEQESRKDKLIVGSEWECVVENRGRNDVFKKGIEVYIWEVKGNFVNFGYGTAYGYVRDSIPIEQFLLCFKFLKEGEQL